MSIFSEFREFIARGNVIDLAVGVIIGAAFNSIVKSLVEQVIMPPVGLLTGGVDFSHKEWILKVDNPATPAIDPVAIQYGAFINTVIQFLIVAWAVFLLVKLVNVIRRADAASAEETPGPTPTEALLIEIRDELRGIAPAPTVAAPSPAVAAKPAARKPAPRKPKA